MSAAVESQGAGQSHEAPVQLSSDQVWRALAKASFAAVSEVTPAGEPRSSGVVYGIAGRRMYVAVAPDSWKATHIATNGTIAITVPVRRGGLLSLLMPIPPATISFHAEAVVHPVGWQAEHPLPEGLERLLPAERQTAARLVEIRPVGQFLTYGIGVPLLTMRTPPLARGRVSVGA